MQFCEKRPKFHAVQFSNLDFIGKVEHLIYLSGYKVERESGNHIAQIIVGEGDDKKVYSLNDWDWLLQDAEGNLSVITDSEMRARFEPHVK